MKSYLWMWAIVTSCCSFLAIVLIRPKPKTPPSKTATLKRGPLCRNLGTLFRNRNFVIMLVGYSLVYGVYTVFGASVSFFTDEYGFTTVRFILLRPKLAILLSALLCVGSVVLFSILCSSLKLGNINSFTLCVHFLLILVRLA